MTPSIVGQPLNNCPICNYDLIGLPKNHRCPECGFEYDEGTLVRDYYLGGWQIWLNYCTLLFWALIFLFKISDSLRTPSGIDWFEITLGILVGASFIIQFLILRAGNRLVVGPTGFAQRLGFLAIRVTSWSEVHFEAEGRNLVWAVRKWRRFLWRPFRTEKPLDDGTVLAEMYDRWKDFHETRHASFRNGK